MTEVKFNQFGWNYFNENLSDKHYNKNNFIRAY